MPDDLRKFSLAVRIVPSASNSITAWERARASLMSLD